MKEVVTQGRASPTIGLAARKTDIANLKAEDIDWHNRKIAYTRHEWRVLKVKQ